MLTIGSSTCVSPQNSSLRCRMCPTFLGKKCFLERMTTQIGGRKCIPQARSLSLSSISCDVLQTLSRTTCRLEEGNAFHRHDHYHCPQSVATCFKLCRGQRAFEHVISGGEDISYAMPDFARFAVAQPPSALGELHEDPELEWRAQVFNLTSTAIEHNEQVQDTSTAVFPMGMMDHTMAEQLCIGEKITNLRQLTKRFGLTSIGKPFPYINEAGTRYCFPGPIPLDNDENLYNKIRIDPAYFGEATTTDSAQWQNIDYPVSRAADGTLTKESFPAVAQLPTRCPLYYISYLYRFWRGSRRYKFATPTTNGLRCTNRGQRPASDDITARNKYDAALDGFEYDAIRPSDPLIVRRSTNIVENGELEEPFIAQFFDTQSSSTFEHYVYPDLNGTIEFEVPYYAQTPISLVGEGRISNVDGPIIRRSKIDIMRSLEPRGLDRPMYAYYDNAAFPQSPIATAADAGGVRNCFGAFNLYEAAGDDFSFGYLIGAPRIRRINHIKLQKGFLNRSFLLPLFP